MSGADDGGVQSVVANANKLLAKQNALMECDAECEREKKLTSLREIYEIKQDNVQTAPMQEEIARKNYMEFKYGDDDYVAEASVDLKKQADVVIAEMTQEWREEKTVVQDLIADYGSLVVSNDDLGKYYDRITASVGRLDSNYAAKKNDTITNDRKAYYQDQGLNGLRYWFYFLRWAYGAIVFTYLVGAITIPTSATASMKYGLLALLVIYPIVVAAIAVSSFALIRSLVSKLPYNAFTMDLGVYKPALNSSTQQYNPGSVEAAVITNASPHGVIAGGLSSYLGQHAKQ